MQPPSVLFILPSSSYRIADFVEAADTLGVEMLVATEGHQTLAATMGDRLVPIDLCDDQTAADRIVAAAKLRRIDAIVPVDDQGVVAAAIASSKLGLTHNPAAAVAATRNKSTLRHKVGAAVRQPAFNVAGPRADFSELGRTLGYPLVAKPLSMSASVGVIRANDEEALGRAVDTIRNIVTAGGADPNEPILIEQYVPGSEVSIDGLIHEGEWTTLAIFDKPDPMEGPHFEETLFVTPSRHPPEVVSEIEAVAAAAVAAVGLRTGAVHAEMRIKGSDVVLLELAARTIGGLCGRALRFGLTSTPIEQLIIRNALGEDIRNIRRESSASGVAMLPVPRQGTLLEIGGVEAARSVANITAVDITARPGDAVRPLPYDGTYLGFVFAKAAGPDEVEAALRTATQTLSIDIE